MILVQDILENPNHFLKSAWNRSKLRTWNNLRKLEKLPFNIKIACYCIVNQWNELDCVVVEAKTKIILKIDIVYLRDCSCVVVCVVGGGAGLFLCDVMSMWRANCGWSQTGVLVTALVEFVQSTQFEQ